MPSLHQALGGNSAASVQQSPTPAAPPAGGSAAGSLQPLPGEDPKAYFQRTGQRMDPALYNSLINAHPVQSPTPTPSSPHPVFNSLFGAPGVGNAAQDPTATKQVEDSFKKATY